MILQALTEYYERKRAVDPDAQPDPGFERKEIPFIIVLSEEGKFLNIEDTREGEGRKKRGRVFTVPQAVKRSSGIRACLLWDKGDYVLGATAAESASTGNAIKAAAKVAQRHRAFREKIEEVFGEDPADPGIRAVLGFLRAGPLDQVRSHLLWANGEATPADYFSFRLVNDSGIVPQRPTVVEAIRAAAGRGEAPVAQCLITGRRAPIAVLHPVIKGIRGAQSSGANIVSFNLDAFRTHGRQQGANAPVSQRAAFAYTTALNNLLDRKSALKANVGDTTVVFWAAQDNVIEDLAGALFQDDAAILDNPDGGVEKLRAVYSSPWYGHPPLREDRSRFYVLGLAPNASRVAIRFWRPTTVSDFATAVLQHFDDVDVVRPPWAARYPSIRGLLRSAAVLGKDDNIPPSLAGAVLDAVITGGAYPRTLLSAAVQRVRSERDVTPDRAATIKGCLVRAARRADHTHPEVSVSLNPSNRNVGYLLGRLFAALERAQETASPGIQSGIRERYYASASATPTTAFPTLMKLKNHHLAKVESRGAVVNLERLLGSIMEGIDDFPAFLPLADQGRFALGYYHQRQAFYTKSDPTEERSNA